MNDKGFDEFEQVAPKRQEKTLHEFKEVLQNLVYLLRTAVSADTACLYWINRSRQQFVKEAQSADIKGARFEDRVSFANHFFNEYKDIKKPARLKNESIISKEDRDKEKTENVLLIPFTNNGETVALTALEWLDEGRFEQQKVVKKYTATLAKLLNTYLEITNLYEGEQEWAEYEQTLAFLERPGHFISLLDTMLQTLQSFLTKGSVSLVTEGPGGWRQVLNSKQAVCPLPIGLSVEKNTVSGDAIKHGSAEFAIHFNGNPKRVSRREERTEGATLAVPMKINKKMIGLVLITDENPLVFSESTKHKLKNIVRFAALEIQSRIKKSGEAPLLTNEYGGIIPDIWERTVDVELKRLKEGRGTYYTWAGFVTLPELAKLRTQLRMEELRHLQKDIIQALSPAQGGVSGFVGFHTDYQYFIFIQSNNESTFKRWRKSAAAQFNEPFVLSNGKQVACSIKTGFIELNENLEDSYEVVQRCKAELNSRKAKNPQGAQTD